MWLWLPAPFELICLVVILNLKSKVFARLAVIPVALTWLNFGCQDCHLSMLTRSMRSIVDILCVSAGPTAQTPHLHDVAGHHSATAAEVVACYLTHNLEKVLVWQDSSRGNLLGYQSMHRHQWAMYTTCLQGIHDPGARESIEELATSSCRAAFPRKAGRAYLDILAMVTLCQPVPYTELIKTSMCRVLWSWKRQLLSYHPCMLQHDEKDWHIVSAARKAVQMEPPDAAHWIVRYYDAIMCQL